MQVVMERDEASAMVLAETERLRLTVVPELHGEIEDLERALEGSKERERAARTWPSR